MDLKRRIQIGNYKDKIPKKIKMGKDKSEPTKGVLDVHREDPLLHEPRNVSRR